MQICFFLRKFFNDGGQANSVIGNDYTLIIKTECPEHFRESMKRLGMGDDPDIYGILSYKNGQVLFLYKGQRIYIMTENGAIFDDLTGRY